MSEDQKIGAVTVNLKNTKEAEEFSYLPAGYYPCKIVEADNYQNENGNQYLMLKMEVMKGSYKGRYIIDRLFYSEKALPRLKAILKRLGLKNDDDGLQIQSVLFLDKFVIIDLDVEHKWIDETSTKPYTQNKVAYVGYYDAEKEENKELLKIDKEQPPIPPKPKSAADVQANYSNSNNPVTDDDDDEVMPF